MGSYFGAVVYGTGVCGRISLLVDRKSVSDVKDLGSVYLLVLLLVSFYVVIVMRCILNSIETHYYNKC